MSGGSGGGWPVPERSMIATVLGVPPFAAVGLTTALTALGVLVDLTRIGTLGLVFTICYVGGCVLGVTWVRRNGLFGPMVAPPLLLAAAIPAVVLLTGTSKPGAGIADRLLVVVAPLINAFPTMAGTTALVLALGAFRLVVQRPSPVNRPPATSRGSAAREAARTSGSPRRS